MNLTLEIMCVKIIQFSLVQLMVNSHNTHQNFTNSYTVYVEEGFLVEYTNWKKKWNYYTWSQQWSATESWLRDPRHEKQVQCAG